MRKKKHKQKQREKNKREKKNYTEGTKKEQMPFSSEYAACV